MFILKGIKLERVGILNKENFSNQEYYVDLVKNINDDDFAKNNTAKKFTIVTFGCQMNEHDSENIKGMLSNMGYNETENMEDADIILYNTCAVRENAESRFFGNIGALKNLKKKNPNLIIATCGCMMQESHIVKELTSKYKHVNIIFGTHNLYKFPELLYTYISLIDKETVVDVWDIDGNIVEGIRKPTIEIGMHVAIMQNRKDVNAVVHTHPFFSQVFACLHEPIPPIIDEAAQAFGGEVRCAEYAIPGTPELANNVVKALGKGYGALLANHGALCVGNTMEVAFKRCTVLEMTAKIYQMASAIGKPYVEDDDVVAITHNFANNHYGQDK